MSKALYAAHPLLAPHTRGQEHKRAAETESLGFVLRVMDSESAIDAGNTAVAALQTSLFTQECMNVCSACCPVFLNDSFAILCGTLGACLLPHSPPHSRKLSVASQDRTEPCFATLNPHTTWHRPRQTIISLFPKHGAGKHCIHSGWTSRLDPEATREMLD